MHPAPRKSRIAMVKRVVAGNARTLAALSFTTPATTGPYGRNRNEGDHCKTFSQDCTPLNVEVGVGLPVPEA